MKDFKSFIKEGFKKGDVINFKSPQGGMDLEGVVISSSGDKVKVRTETHQTHQTKTFKTSEVKKAKNPSTGVDR